jgi:ribosomal protein L24
MAKIKKGDQVIVIAGKEKGKQGRSCSSPMMRQNGMLTERRS